MRCKKAESYIWLNLDGEINEKQKIALDKHLESCSFCNQLQGEFSNLKQSLSQMPDVEFPEFLHHRIMNALPRRSKRAQALRLNLSLAATALSIILSIAAGTLVGLKGFEDPAAIVQSISEEDSGQLLFGENSIMVVSYDE